MTNFCFSAIIWAHGDTYTHAVLWVVRGLVQVFLGSVPVTELAPLLLPVHLRSTNPCWTWTGHPSVPKPRLYGLSAELLLTHIFGFWTMVGQHKQFWRHHIGLMGIFPITLFTSLASKCRNLRSSFQNEMMYSTLLYQQMPQKDQSGIPGSGQNYRVFAVNPWRSASLEIGRWPDSAPRWPLAALPPPTGPAAHRPQWWNASGTETWWRPLRKEWTASHLSSPQREEWKCAFQFKGMSEAAHSCFFIQLHKMPTFKFLLCHSVTFSSKKKKKS